jgi:hypothetical protein
MTKHILIVGCFKVQCEMFVQIIRPYLLTPTCADKRGIMVFNASFNNISVISWRSVLLVEETGGLGASHRPTTSH